jgi:hypothetical protein
MQGQIQFKKRFFTAYKKIFSLLSIAFYCTQYVLDEDIFYSSASEDEDQNKESQPPVQKRIQHQNISHSTPSLTWTTPDYVHYLSTMSIN